MRLGRALRSFGVAAAVIGGVGSAAFAGLLYHHGRDPRLPRIEALAAYTSLSSTRVLDRNGLLVGEVGAARHSPVPFERISPALVQAVLTDEPAFLQGSGLDWRGLARAVTASLRFFGAVDRPVSISHAAARRAFATPDASFKRRLQEVILVFQLSRQLPRPKIVELALNYGHYGGLRFGCEAAARYYFGVPARQVTPGQAALLAALQQTPTPIDPRRQPHLVRESRCEVLQGMARSGALAAGQAHQLCIEPPAFAREPHGGLSYAPEVVDSITRRLTASHGPDKLDTLGLAVPTTIDLPLQTVAWETVGRQLEALDARLGRGNRSGRLAGAALDRKRAQLRQQFAGGLPHHQVFEAVVDRVEADPSRPRAGRIFLDVGAGTGLVDLAEEPRYTLGATDFIDGLRPGDLLRVRAAPERLLVGEGDAPAELPLALAERAEAAVVVMDVATREVLALVGGYHHRSGNLDRAQRPRPPGATLAPFVYAAALESRKHTLLQLRRPFIESLDSHLPRLALQVGEVAVRELAARAGVITPLPRSARPPEAVALQVTPLELANVYATLAGGGLPGVPSLVPTAGGSVGAVALVPAPTAYLLTSLLGSVVVRGAAAGIHTALPRPIAALPAVASDGKDAWFVGFTPDLVVVAWVGHDDGRPLGLKGTQPNPAEQIWLPVMQQALGGRADRAFTRPPGLVVARLDPRTGRRLERTEPGIDELFLPGTEPRFQRDPDEDTPPESSAALPATALLGHPWMTPDR
jgi:penicillin-binding protein 1A